MTDVERVHMCYIIGGAERLKRLAGYHNEDRHRASDTNYARMNSTLDRHGQERKQMVKGKGKIPHQIYVPFLIVNFQYEARTFVGSKESEKM